MGQSKEPRTLLSLRALLVRLLGAFRRRRSDERLNDEIDAHLALLTDEYRSRGLSAEDAARAARRAFGGVTQTKEAWRDERRLPFSSVAVQDIRYAVRVLAHSPSFSFASILTIALSVAVSTLVFRVGYSLLVRPLPYDDPDKLVTLAATISRLPPEFPTIPIRAKDFLRFRQSDVGLSGLGAVTSTEFTLTGHGDAELLHGARVSASLFPLLGLRPALGRTFRDDEDAPGQSDVVVISHDLWVRRFGAQPTVLDSPITLNGRPHTVLGVLRPDALFPTGKQLHPLVGLGPRVDIWRPMAFTPAETAAEGSWDYGVIGRLAPGVDAAQAQGALNSVATAIASELRSAVGLDINLAIRVSPLRDVFSRTGAEGLRTIAVAAALLALIACVNLAHLWFGRIAQREHELTVRAALGASRRRVARQLLTEAALLAIPGALAGGGLAQLGARSLVSLGPADLGSVGVARLDAPGIAFAALAAALSALLAAVVPVARAARATAGHAVAGRYTGRGIRHGRTRRILVAAETAVCTGMLGVSALLLHSWANVWAVERGFVADQVLAIDLTLPVQPYAQERVVPFYGDLLARLRKLLAVRHAAATTAVPLVSEENTTGVFFESDDRQTLERPIALQRGVTSGYFETMLIPLVAGRTFEERESQTVVIVSAALAAQLWPGDSPHAVLGRRVRTGDVKSLLRTIVGVVGDVREGSLDRRSLPTIYRPHAQFPSRAMTIVLRTSGPPGAVASAVRAELRALDPNLPVVGMRPMSDIVTASVAPRRFQSVIVTALATLALALACVGVYGAASYAVSSGVKEVGVRVALGADPRSVLSLVFLRGFRPVLIGVGLGLLLAPMASALVRHLLFQVTPVDPLALGGVCLVLVAVAGLVCYAPARRAARIDPVTALRQE